VNSKLLRGVCFVLCLTPLVGSACVAAPLVVSLDFFVNPNHAPLYVAEALGFFDEESVEVEIVVPANPSDPVKLAAAGAIDMALTPQINYMIARSEGLPLIAIGALIDRSLGGLLGVADHGFTGMDSLRGGRIGYSLAPLEPILWRTMLACAGIDEHEVELVNIGFNTMQALLAGSVDAIGAFRNFEPLQVELEGYEPVFVPQEAHCIPLTQEILFVVHAAAPEEREDALAGFLRATASAITWITENPDEAMRLFFEVHPDLDDELNRRSFVETLPLFARGARHDDAAVWEAVQMYLAEQQLISQTFPIEALYTSALLPED